MSKNGKTTIITTVSLTFIACAVIFFIAERITKKTVRGTIEKQVSSLVLSAKNAVIAYNDSNFSTIHIAASLPIIRDPNVPIKQKAEQLFGVREADPSLIGLNITDLQGNSYLVEGPLYNFSERAYFKNALQGKERSRFTSRGGKCSFSARLSSSFRRQFPRLFLRSQ